MLTGLQVFGIGIIELVIALIAFGLIATMWGWTKLSRLIFIGTVVVAVWSMITGAANIISNITMSFPAYVFSSIVGIVLFVGVIHIFFGPRNG